jgi:hypothetical protein
MLASAHHREDYRRALGAGENHTVIALSSTWWRHSLLGEWPELAKRLLAELPHDSYRVVAIVHPNVWHGHGPWQIRSWLADCVRSGLIVVPAVEGWRAALIAADCVIGDHGSVTAYGAALDKTTLLGAFPAEDVAPKSPVDVLGGIAPKLRRDQPLRSQVDRAIAEYRAGTFAPVTDLVTSAPNEALERLRRLCYSLLDLAEPLVEPPVHQLTTAGLTAPQVPTAMLVNCSITGTTASITRYPAELPRGFAVDKSHLVVHIDHPGRRMLGAADVIVGDCRGNHEDWLRAVIVDRPAIALAATQSPDGVCHARTRDGDRFDLLPDSEVDVGLCASLAYALMVRQGMADTKITVRAGALDFTVAVRPVDVP